MIELPRETRVLDAVVSLVDSMLDDFHVVDLLTELTEQYEQLLDVAAGGIAARHPAPPVTADGCHGEGIHIWSCSSCRLTRARAWTAMPPGSRSRWPTCRRTRRGGRGCRGRQRGGLRLGARGAMRAAARVGCLGLFGTGVGELNDADRLAAQTLGILPAWRSCRTTPPPGDGAPHLHAALTAGSWSISQGIISKRLDVSIDDAFTLLRRYARTDGDHLTELSRRLITEPEASQTIWRR